MFSARRVWTIMSRWGGKRSGPVHFRESYNFNIKQSPLCYKRKKGYGHSMHMFTKAARAKINAVLI